MSIHLIESELQLFDTRWYKIIYVCGSVNHEKQYSSALNIPYININLRLSEKLQNIPKSNYPLQVGDMLNETFSQYHDSILWLGNIEILFDKQLQQHPVRLLEHLSKRFKLIVSWPGEFDGKALIYATPEHPEYFKCSELEGKIVIV
ncbi:BREX-3 system P-loop-containing protein BrxF [Bacillus methanolicus]|uniref:BREX-3 system P-loop-containing protein BrxF n=1 Tax=Bacillus methanolicus (strain MGA3 / ATCC 53907) TaxID=796606 RepID=I3DU50_BACMM|nr:BREX-3 system P-loop-containing protein BrxF [Bacillus methanolicus]AIE59869.1 hypothetical protein BMMGA3_07260 [Bacillus methanolicus MGA3]EIJ77771.1 hypothetical protein MGA3_16698 [Bacillus methanolicus MGA3]